MAYNTNKENEAATFTKEHVAEALNEALDSLVSDNRSEFRKRTGASFRALNGLNRIDLDILKEET